MKKKFFVIGGILIIAGAAGVGGWYYYKENYASSSASKEVAYVTKISTLIGEDSGVLNRFAGVVEPQDTVKVNIESGRTVTEVKVKTGDEVKKGQLLFEYDLSSIEDSLQAVALPYHPEPHQQHLGRILEFRKLDYFEHCLYLCL